MVNILLVDDQPGRLLSYEAILGKLGENLVRASSGEEALARLMEMEFAVILLDVNMPGMDGFETASLIHQHPRHEKTPIIFVTAVHISDLDRLRGYNLGAVDYVFVPVVAEILRSKVAVLCELFRQRRELHRLNRSLESANAELAQANAALLDEKALELHRLNIALERSNRELAHTNASLHDEITERRRMEVKLREADRRKDEFLATLAHELRNPLAPIRNALRLLQIGDEHSAVDAVQIMERQLRQLVRLIDDLLDVARISRGKLAMRKRRTTLQSIIEDAIEAVAPTLDEAGQHLKVDLPEQPLPIEADSERLSQVFANLLNNASKYSDPDTSIGLKVRTDGDKAVVEVIDKGIGLASDKIGSVFELFVQADTSLERSRGGLGIGLTLVQQLVEMHGGRVAAHSPGLGAGSTFVVEVPLRSATGTAPLAPIESPPLPATITPRRILVVDDNRDAADTLALTLQVLQHEVRVTYDPLAACTLGAEFLPDLVFMDVGMPGMNGYDLARLMRAQVWSAQTLLVALTGWGQDEDRLRSQQAGFDHHLVKPAEFADIERMCVTWKDADPIHSAGTVK